MAYQIGSVFRQAARARNVHAAAVALLGILVSYKPLARLPRDAHCSGVAEAVLLRRRYAWKKQPAPAADESTRAVSPPSPRAGPPAEQHRNHWHGPEYALERPGRRMSNGCMGYELDLRRS